MIVSSGRQVTERKVTTQNLTAVLEWQKKKKKKKRCRQRHS